MKNTIYRIVFAAAFILLCTTQMYAADPTTFEGKRIWVFGSGENIEVPSEFNSFTRENLASAAKTKGTTASFDGITTTLFSTANEEIADTYFATNYYQCRRTLTIRPGTNADGTLYLKIQGCKNVMTENNNRTLKITYTDDNNTTQIITRDITGNEGQLSFDIVSTANINISCDETKWYRVYYIAWQPTVTKEDIVMRLSADNTNLFVGDDTSLIPYFYDGDDEDATQITSISSGVIFSTTTPNIVSVGETSGYVQALSAGTAVINATFPGNARYNGATATIYLNVNKTQITGAASLEKNLLNPGESTTLTITWSNNGEEVTENSIVYTGDDDVATVANGGAVAAGTNGSVTGVATGNTELKIGLNNSNRYCTYSHIWDFDAMSEGKADKAGVEYSTDAITVNGYECNLLTGDLEGIAAQGADKFIYRNAQTMKGLMHTNGGPRYVVIRNLDAGDIVTLVFTGGTPSLYSNGVAVPENENNSGVYIYRVSADGDFVFVMPRSANGVTVLLHSITVEAATPIHVPVSVTSTMVQPSIKAADGAAISTLTGTALGLEASGTVDIDGRFGAFDKTTNITTSGTLSFEMPSGDITLSGTTLTASASGTNDLTISWTPTYTNTHSLGLTDAALNLRGLTDYDAATSTATTTGDGNRYIGWNFGSDGLEMTGYTHALVEVEPTTIPLRLVVDYVGYNGTYKDFPAGTRYIYVPIAADLKASQIYINLLGSGEVKIVSAKLADGQYLPEEETISIQAVDKAKTNLYMRAFVKKSKIEIDETAEVTVKYYSDEECNNEITDSDLTATYKSSKTSIATVDNTSGEVTGQTTGTVTITATTTGNSTYQGATATVEVEVEKIHLTITITPDNPAKMQAETQQLTATVKSTRTLDEISGLDIKWSMSSKFDPDESGYDANYTALVDVSKTGLVTAMNAGHGAGVPSGKAKITAAFDGSKDSRYYSTSTTIDFIVNDNTCFDYMGWDLVPGHTGTLYNSTNTSQNYVHWRFGAPNDDNGVQVFRYNGNNNKMYEFTSEIIALKNVVHTSESPIDPFSKTRLTDTQRTSENGVQLDAKGDAFLEYNGMIAGYGTEFGGRYMTPISGTFVRIEAEYDGVVSILIRHNGSVDNSNAKEDGKSGDKTKYKNITQARRALFVVDENGVVMPRTSNYATLDAYGYFDNDFRSTLGSIDGTYARISSSSKVGSTYDIVNDAYTYWFTYKQDNTDGILKTGSGNNVDFSRNAFEFSRKVIYSDYSDEEYNSKIRSGNGGDPQKLFYSANQTDVEYQATDVATKSYFFSKYGYEVLGAAHLSISFPVEAGKTYFVGANKSKIGLCSVGFIPSTSYSATNVTLYEDAVDNPQGDQHSNAWLLNTVDGAHLNVTLKRTFKANHWHPLVLPFSVSETQLKSIFGNNVAIISLDGDLKMLSSMNNYATRDLPTGVTNFYDSTTPVYDDKNNYQGVFNGRVIKPSAIRDQSVTFTRHYYQMIYANCPVFLWVDHEVTDPKFTNVTFQKYTMQRDEVENKSTVQRTPAINDDYTVTFPYSVDRQIGTGSGTDHDYVMKASYVSSQPTGEIYYLNNLDSGSSVTAYLYHAEAGYAPTMKGTRVWIEPGPSNPKLNAPLRSIRMQQFWGEDIETDDVVTGIMDITADQPIESMMYDDNVYDVAGRVVGYGSTDGLNPGLYIYKGRKIYIR